MEDLEPEAASDARRAKWLFALLLCPACGLGFLWTLGGVGLGSALAANGWVVAGGAALLAGVIATVVVRRRRRAC
jgi:hypothetical protein